MFMVLRRLLAAVVMLSASMACPQSTAAFTRCEDAPEPASVEEMALMLQNAQHHARRRLASKAQEPALLALSDGGLRIAFAAGLLAGWGETGDRPDFATVTAVGKGALLAPFAFVGAAGDPALARIIACTEAGDWRALARDAAIHLTPRVMEVMAQRHRSGARLLVIVPGSPVRPETVWDMGAIAILHGAAAPALFEDILSAAVDIGYVPRAKGGTAVARNMVFREVGAGEAFAWPRDTATRFASVTLVHAAVLFADESDDFVAAYRHRAPAEAHWVMPAAAFADASRIGGARFRFASMRPKLNLPQGPVTFDLAYARGLYLHAYRHGRMNTAWQPTLPSLRRP